MSKFLFVVLCPCLLISQVSCSTSSTSANRGQIVLGDSSLIVTETDSRYLSNNVDDIVPHTIVVDTIQPVLTIDTPESLTSESKKEEEKPKPLAKNGLSAPFNSMEIFIENVKGREAKNINWAKEKSAAFTLTQGNLEGKMLMIDGEVVTKVKQRTQTVVMLKLTDGKYYELINLPASNSNWETLNGSNGKYNIVGLDKKSLKYDKKVSHKALHNALQKLVRSNRLSRKEEQKLLSSVKSINQAPCSIGLKSVIWKIAGKDASGKMLECELRIDINL